jgi:hypothetical protein
VSLSAINSLVRNPDIETTMSDKIRSRFKLLLDPKLPLVSKLTEFSDEPILILLKKRRDMYNKVILKEYVKSQYEMDDSDEDLNLDDNSKDDLDKNTTW